MIFDNRLISQLLYAQEVPLQLQYVLLIHRDDLYRVQFFRLFVLAFVNSCVGPLPNQLLEPVFLVESVDIAFLFLLILVGIPTQKCFMKEAISILQALPPESVLLFFGLDL